MGYQQYNKHNNNNKYNNANPQAQNQSSTGPSYATMGAAAAGTAAVAGAGYMAYQHYNRPQHGQKVGQFGAMQQMMQTPSNNNNQVGANGVNDSENQQYVAEFKKLDKDNSGSIERKEVQKMLGRWVPGKLIDAVMKMGDKDGDGKIDLNEYIALRKQMGGKVKV